MESIVEFRFRVTKFLPPDVDSPNKTGPPLSGSDREERG